MSKIILVVSHEGDKHAHHLVEHASMLGQKALLWDVSKYPEGSEVSITLQADSHVQNVFLTIDGIQYHSEEIAGVWWRRPGGGKKIANDSQMGQYVKVESDFVIHSLRDFLPKSNWLSDPESTRLACRKPVQLKVARVVGFRTPETCITNSPVGLKEFIDHLGGRQMIMKPIGSAFIQLDTEGRVDTGKNQVIFTKVIEPELLLGNIDMVKNCPVIFQEAIIKDSDIRITVVDDNVFAAEIHLDGCSDPTNLDWRNYAGTRQYSRHKLPNSISTMCVEIVRQLGLRFGCIDLGYSAKDGYTFFEVNPQGQWLPSELTLGYTISGSIVASLAR